MEIDDLELSVRSNHFCRACDLKYVKDIIQYTAAELLSHKNIGRRSLNEITTVLKKFGLSLKEKE